ncbi:Alpha-(1,3)-fucosyltransferase 7 [Sparganum proliferum]
MMTPTETLKYSDIYYNRYCVRQNSSKMTYGYASVIQQMRWITSNNQTAIEKDGPLIFYDSRFLWHRLSSDGCKYYCQFSTNFVDYRKARLAVFTQNPPKTALPKPDNQTWALESGESPFHMPRISVHLRQHFKLFLTTKSDSHVPWVYAVFVANYKPDKSIPPERQIRMLSDKSVRWLPAHHTRRRKKVVALVSNTNPRNRRMQYIEQLAKYIDVHVYGRGRRYCPPDGAVCLQQLATQYKFYLAFENSDCEDYITEKLFINALKYSMLPVVMGAPRSSYCALAPPNSFIHVDDFPSPADLADYLTWLDQKDSAYASYFAWQEYGKIVKETRIDCRLCGFLHQHPSGLPSVPSNNFNYFTSVPRQCIIY